jgi:hyaluronate lyase
MRYTFSSFPGALLWLLLALTAPTARADDFDVLRQKQLDVLTGGTAINTADPDITTRIATIDADANARWSSLIKTANRTYLWATHTDGTNRIHVLESYRNLRTMALAYATTGSTLQGNATLKTDILNGLDFINANWYNPTKNPTSNWFEWEIGIPFILNDLLLLMYPNLSATQITNNVNAIDHFSPDPTKAVRGANITTGANRTWKCKVVLFRGIIGKSAAKITQARDALSQEFLPVLTSDGFYSDGSFIQHTRHPYTGGYGVGFIASLTEVLNLLVGSAWPITDANLVNVYRWVFDAYEPVLYKGGVMAMVEGREIARPGSEEHRKGHTIIDALLWLADSFPTTSIGSSYPANPAEAIRRRLKYLITADTYLTYSPASIYLVQKRNALLADTAITAAPELVKHYTFGSMDRVVHRRNDYTFGISMYSNRVFNYESINTENTRGWHTGSGMTYLYNIDIGQFSNNFWPTVNSQRLPGTTVEQNSTFAQKLLSDQGWVGGANLTSGFGTAGMRLHAGNLYAKKSWFMFDDEVVALGVDVRSTTVGKIVETIIENRMLNTTGDNPLTVNGTPQSTTIGWSRSLTGVTSMHLAGNVPGSDIGYYFPTAQAVKGLRESRTAKWGDINAYPGIVTDNTNKTNRFLTLWFDHGTVPTAGTYSYVLLPGKTATQTTAYQAAPQVQVLQNVPNVQAVRESSLSVVAANFWADVPQTLDIPGSLSYISTSRRAAILVDEDPTSLEVAVSDPTMAVTGNVLVEVRRAVGTLISKSDQVTVVQTTPTLKLSVAVTGMAGATLRAKFNRSGARLGATEPKVGLQLELLPNPASGEFRAQCFSPEAQSGTLQLTDARGRVVLSSEVSLLAGTTNVPVRVPAGEAGLYLVRLVAADQTVVEKIILYE